MKLQRSVSCAAVLLIIVAISYFAYNNYSDYNHGFRIWDAVSESKSASFDQDLLLNNNQKQDDKFAGRDKNDQQDLYPAARDNASEKLPAHVYTKDERRDWTELEELDNALGIVQDDQVTRQLAELKSLPFEIPLPGTDGSSKNSAVDLGWVQTRALSTTKKRRLVLLAGVPGSGIAHLRHMIEALTGLVVESLDSCILESKDQAEHQQSDSNATRLSSKQENDATWDDGLEWSDYSHCYAMSCGWAGDCATVRRSSASRFEPIIYETSLPFGAGTRASNFVNKMTSGVDHVVVLTKLPLDILTNRGLDLFDDQVFSGMFEHFVNFWLHRNLDDRQQATTLVRSEDLFEFPEHILASIMHLSGLWTDLNISPEKISAAVKAWRESHETIILSKVKRTDVSKASHKYAQYEQRAVFSHAFLWSYVTLQPRDEHTILLALSRRRNHRLLHCLGYYDVMTILKAISDMEILNMISKDPSKLPNLPLAGPMEADSFAPLSALLNKLLFSLAHLNYIPRQMLLFAGMTNLGRRRTTILKLLPTYVAYSPTDVFVSQPSQHQDIGNALARQIFKSMMFPVPSHVYLAYMQNHPHRQFRVFIVSLPHVEPLWLRTVIEFSTEMISSSTFPEMNSVYNTAIGAYSIPCEYLQQHCEAWTSNTLTPAVVIETNEPFMSLARSTVKLENHVEIKDPSYAVFHIQNPLEAYFQWKEYLMSQGASPGQLKLHHLQNFVQAWADYNDYWHSQNMPMTVIRHEDLAIDSWGSLRRVLAASGLWQHMHVTETRVAKMASNRQLLYRLRDSYLGEHIVKTFSISDIQWTLDTFRPALAMYGYDLLYEAWIDGLRSQTLASSTWGQRISKIIEDSGSYASWGEYWMRFRG